ncbi:unnamed protein product, partial [Ectocarpus sp. 12 AP-2014]
ELAEDLLHSIIQDPPPSLFHESIRAVHRAPEMNEREGARVYRCPWGTPSGEAPIGAGAGHTLYTLHDDVVDQLLGILSRHLLVPLLPHLQLLWQVRVVLSEFGLVQEHGAQRRSFRSDGFLRRLRWSRPRCLAGSIPGAPC